MKILTLGDIHGRTCWKNIIQRENPDLTIFLGDYVTSHDYIRDEIQINNVYEILDYKESNPSKCILLRGNHDLQCLYNNSYAWNCIPEPSVKLLSVCSSAEFKDRFLNNTQWIYILNDIIFSHAGISKTWLHDTEKSIEDINDLEPDENLFGFRPNSLFDTSGDSVTQSCIWIRPQSLVEDCLDDYNQVVGHSTVKKIIDLKNLVSNLKNSIWICDNLPDEYLIYENGKFESRENYTS